MLEVSITALERAGVGPRGGIAARGGMIDRLGELRRATRRSADADVAARRSPPIRGSWPTLRP